MKFQEREMKTLFIGSVFLMMMGAGAHAQSTVELVQSVPIETTLTVPGIPLTQDVWLALVQSAKTSIDIEQYYINNVAGESLEPIINALKAAGARGVKIRFLIDSAFIGEKGNSKEASCLEGIENLEIKKIDFSKLGGIMHAKYMVVDQSRLYVGSANFDWLALTHIHEIGLHIVDATLAAQLEKVFNLDWNATTATSLPKGSFAELSKWIETQSKGGTHKRKPKDGLTGFEVVGSPTVDLPNGVTDTLSTITGLIASAKRNLNIQVYEYTTKGDSGTWTVLDQSIRAAAARGVKVQMLLDAVTLKQGSKDLTALGKLPNISVRTVIIPEWSGGPLAFARLIHSKYLTVDDSAAWVGSENWIENYFTGTRNAGVTTSSAQIATQLNQIFNQVWTSTYTTQQ
jgi:phosphatidylserine/phosphatidylglycerophosphate/cardiolipin synthase-like enzyme